MGHANWAGMVFVSSKIQHGGDLEVSGLASMLKGYKSSQKVGRAVALLVLFTRANKF